MSTYITTEQNQHIEQLILQHQINMQAANSARIAHKQAKKDDPSIKANVPVVYTELPEPLGQYIYTIVEHIMAKGSYAGYTGALRDIMHSDALIDCIRSTVYFDKSKMSGFSFLSYVAIQALKSAIKNYKQECALMHELQVDVCSDELTETGDASICIPIWDNEVEVNSALYNSLHEEDDGRTDEEIYQRMKANMWTYQQKAKKLGISLEQVLLETKARMEKTRPKLVKIKSALKGYNSAEYKAAYRRAYYQAHKEKELVYRREYNRKWYANRKAAKQNDK